jgi:hypothetical protein
MDLKLDQQRREKIQALLNKEAAQKADILGNMERDFTQIFGEGAVTGLSVGDDDSGSRVLGEAVSFRLDSA